MKDNKKQKTITIHDIEIFLSPVDAYKRDRRKNEDIMVDRKWIKFKLNS